MGWTVYNSDGQILQGSATLANDSIDSQHYVAASIDNEHLADDAVDSDEIAAGAIDLAHMSSQSVDEDNLYISNAGSNGEFLSKQSGNSGGLTWATAGGIASLAADTTPQVGGSAGLDLQAQLLVGNGGTTGIAISANGEVTMAAQPAVYAYNQSTRTDVTGDNTVYTLECNLELFDQNADYASNVFTAPVTGRYYARTRVAAGAVDTNQASGNLKIVSTLNTFGVWSVAPNDIIDSNESTLHYEDAFFSMTAGNTVYVTFAVNSGAKDVNVNGGIGTTDFGIWLVA